jgi:hypothetical protein
MFFSIRKTVICLLYGGETVEDVGRITRTERQKERGLQREYARNRDVWRKKISGSGKADLGLPVGQVKSNVHLYSALSINL